MMKQVSDKARLILTIGDPNGIGPEIILKIFNNKAVTSRFDLFVVGTKNIFDKYSNQLSLPKIESSRIIELSYPKGFNLKPGSVDRKAGKISGDAIKKAIELCVNNEFDGMVTLPISKDAFNSAGYKYPGHTEMLTKLTDSRTSSMIMYSNKLILSLITVHIPLSLVNKKITETTILTKVISVNNSLVKDFKIKKPRFAILGLNPHAGDGGKLGETEIKVIEPAIHKLKEAGFNIEGPFPADGFFANKAYKNFDATIAMYHDQGLIPFKMISKDKGINYTAGINIVRTSPNHGTGFDIAGKGIANPNSTIEAIKLSAKLTSNRK